MYLPFKEMKKKRQKKEDNKEIPFIMNMKMKNGQMTVYWKLYSWRKISLSFVQNTSLATEDREKDILHTKKNLQTFWISFSVSSSFILASIRWKKYIFIQSVELFVGLGNDKGSKGNCEFGWQLKFVPIIVCKKKTRWRVGIAEAQTNR